MALPLPSTSSAGSVAFHTVPPPPPLLLLPLRATVKAFVSTDPGMQALLKERPNDQQARHLYAQTLLAADKVEEALMVLLWEG